MRRPLSRARRHLDTALYGLLLAAVLAGPGVAAERDGSPTRLVVLDVGEGQALLFARGQRGLMIDTGRPGMGRHVLDRLAHHGVETLDTVVYTHPHPDHVGSWFRLREAFPGVKVIDNGHRRAGTNWPDTSRWVAAALDRLPGGRHRVAGLGDEWQWQGIRFRVHWPETTQGGGLNERSLVIEANPGGATVLIMGDAGKDAERELLERDRLPADADILVAGHHGSARTASRAFLAHVRPRYAAVSTDADNLRGYPAAETMERLEGAARTAVLRTWEDGEICFLLEVEEEPGRC